ncbi:hypothetical protein N7474_010102 [Penicillium riverlandense]|uniref:uncharacterized protein n=1 Tax=Penicillium riverlandense TaxID=1903569 RepID=UPI0025479053|nr:uncharacterized protein N7474_010102 [Penicillium riverlandense]KAJ5808833.1 hypothetical protein N7474_010102 [Penicillium riverlandense]
MVHMVILSILHRTHVFMRQQMETQMQTLLNYLSIALPTIPTQGTTPGPNTTNPQYDADDITHIVPWSEFSYSTIILQYAELLNTKRIRPDPFTSPPAPLKDEATFHLRFSDLVMNRVRRALRAGFEQLSPQLATHRLSETTIDGGGSARIVDQFRPDAAFIVVGASLSTGVNRAPGDLKVSWKWRSSMQFSQNLADQREYKQVLAQVNFYMDQHNARHGFILSNLELVAIKRLDRDGRLAVATPVLWASGGAGRLSVLLGLWYLGMLAAEDNHWALD